MVLTANSIRSLFCRTEKFGQMLKKIQANFQQSSVKKERETVSVTLSLESWWTNLLKKFKRELKMLLEGGQEYEGWYCEPLRETSEIPMKKPNSTAITSNIEWIILAANQRALYEPQRQWNNETIIRKRRREKYQILKLQNLCVL